MMRRPGVRRDGSGCLWSRRIVFKHVYLLIVVATLIVMAETSSTLQTSDVITAARCRVRCLMQLKTTTDLPHLAGSGKESMALINCLKLPDCTSCLKPCNQPILSVDACHDICSLPKDDDVCLESCEFLQQIRFAHAGTCPSFSSGLSSSKQDGACARACITDTDCDINLKCCAQKCGTACTLLQLFHSDFPLIPETPTLKERPKSGSIELKWNSVSNSSGPLLYIVDSRWSIGRDHISKDMTQWQQVAQTSSTSAMINDITPGHWYQFRVSSVNIQGTRGGSVPTQAFTLSKDPRKPGRPTNLTEGDTLIMGSKMAVTLHWFPPDKSDLPITRYKLYWNKRSRSSVQPSLAPRESRHVLPGHKLVFQIPNLESATTYFVQVQAICQYGDVRLKSEKSGIYITTYPVPQASDMFPSAVEFGVGGGSRSLAAPAAPVNLTAQQPFYLNGVLSVNVSWVLTEEKDDSSNEKVDVHWSPEACIADSTLEDDLSKIMSSSTQDSFFVIHDLRPDCRYVVKVETVSGRGVTGSSAQISLLTPSCGQAPVLGKHKPDCLNNVPRVPEEPPNLVHSFVIRSSNLTSRLTWGVPDSVSPITGYRIVWGQLLHIHQASPTMDKSTAVTKVLAKNIQTYSIGSLNEGTTYIVRVQAMSRSGAGRIAVVQFTTPLLQVKSVDPPYREFGDGRKSDPSRRKQNLTVVTAMPHGFLGGDKATSLKQIIPTVTLASLRLTCSLTTFAIQFVFLFILNPYECFMIC